MVDARAGTDFLPYLFGGSYASIEPIMAEYLKTDVDHADLFAARESTSGYDKIGIVKLYYYPEVTRPSLLEPAGQCALTCLAV